MRGFKLTKLVALAILLTAAAGQMTSALAQVANVFQTNSLWRYSYANPYVCLDGTGWETKDYNDSAWPEAIGGFTGGEGVGASYVGVTTATLPAPPAVSGQIASFRKHFNIPNINGVSLILSNRYDDGIVIWINGTEVARLNAGTAGDPVACATLGTDHEASVGWGVITLTPAQLAGILVNGDNVIAVAILQVNTTSSDMVFAMQMWSEIAFPVTITDTSGLASQTSTQCLSASFTVGVNGSSPISFQWFKDGAPIDSAVIASATNQTLLLNNLTIPDGGNYTVQVMNPLATVTSSPAAVLTVLPDTTPPTIVRVIGEADLVNFTVTFSEPMDHDQVADQFAYGIRSDDGLDVLNILAIVDPTPTTILITTASPRDPAKNYILVVNEAGGLTIAENCNKDLVIAPNTIAPVVPAFSFQQNVNGYTGTQDAEIHSLALADTTLGTTQPATMGVDLDDTGVAQSLLRFDNIFGSGPGLIPPGAQIVSADLILNQVDPGSEVRIHRMLVSFGDQNTVTWNTMGDGVTADNVEATVAFDSQKAAGAASPIIFNVTPSLQAWADGQPNNGWVFLALGTDGTDFSTSEGATAPQLKVVYALVACSPISIVTQPIASTNVNEGASFSLSVAVTSPGCAPTFQWTRNGQNIPNATNSSYAVASAGPGDAGTYQVVVGNAAPSSAMSTTAAVTVNTDTTRPVLVSALGTTNASIVNLTFSEPISAATGGSTASYSLVPIGGGAALAINSATVTGSNIVLNTAARVAGTGYQLTITGLRDTASADNLLNPNPTVVNPLLQDILVFNWNQVWRYETNCLDGMNWQAVGFNDSAWPSGPGSLGFETTAGISNLMASLGAPILTELPIGSNTLAYYFRTTFTWPYSTVGVQFHLSHLVDDGAIFYLNGTPVASFFETNSPPLSCTNLSSGGGEASLQTTNIAGVATGSNLLAVEIHQQSATSSDVLLGAQLIARVGSFAAQGPRLTITTEGANVRIMWSPASGTLQFKNSLDDASWTDVPAQTAGNTLVARDQVKRFYTLRQ